MRLLIVDEEMISGGVETLRLNLLPELANLCESVVWALPWPFCENFRDRMCVRPNLIFESLSWPRGTKHQLWAAALRRVPRLPLSTRLVKDCTRQNINARVRALAREHASAACLTTCVLSQPPPLTGLPLAGIVCDVNPALPKLVRENIISWLSFADATLAISEFTCAELRCLAPDFAAQIHAVPLAAPPRLSAPVLSPDRQFDFYFPAAANTHKGHLVLFQACVALVRRGNIFRLALSGPGTDGFLPDHRFDNREMEKTWRFFHDHAEELNDCIFVAGDLKPSQVAAYYGSSRCVVLPSRYEGFGLPFAEALQYGKEILCSDIPPFREQLAIYGALDCATMVAPEDPMGLADAMELILKSPAARLRDPAKLRQRMARWRWADVARRCYDQLSLISK